MKNKEIITRFKLPAYISGKSFAEASKIIDNKFKDRNDIISKRTKQELLERLTNAQEFVKQSENDNSTNQFDTGGTIASGVAQGADLATDTFGPTGIDMSGLQPGGKVNTTGNVLSGAGKGAAMGATVGSVIPGLGTLIGGAIGGVVGAGAGLLKSGRQEKDSNTATQNYMSRMNYQLNNPWAKGGYVNKYSGTDLPSGYMDDLNSAQYLKYLNEPIQNPLPYTTSVKNPLKPMSPTNTIFTNDSKKKLKSTINTANQNVNSNPIFGDKYKNDSPVKSNDKTQSKVSTIGANALRYAPVISNAMQLMNMQKPTVITSSRLGNKFKPTYMDERLIRNQVDQELNNSINAITNASGGSGAASRAGILASGLNRAKALSDSYAKIAEYNAGQNTQGQQIDMQRDIQNLGQERYDTEINLRSKGAYDTNRSMLQSALANDLGSIGKEELYKKYPEMIGLGYKWDGTYWKDNQGNTVDPEKVTNKKMKGGYLNDVLSNINFRYNKKISK